METVDTTSGARELHVLLLDNISQMTYPWRICFLSIARTLEWVAMPSSRGSPDPEVEPESLTSLALVGGFFVTSSTWEAQE